MNILLFSDLSFPDIDMVLPEIIFKNWFIKCWNFVLFFSVYSD